MLALGIRLYESAMKHATMARIVARHQLPIPCYTKMENATTGAIIRLNETVVFTLKYASLQLVLWMPGESLAKCFVTLSDALSQCSTNRIIYCCFCFSDSDTSTTDVHS